MTWRRGDMVALLAGPVRFFFSYRALVGFRMGFRRIWEGSVFFFVFLEWFAATARQNGMEWMARGQIR